MKKCYLILFILISGICFSQKISEQDIEGNWKVVEMLSRTPNNLLNKGFENAIFIFGKDKSFQIKTTSNSMLFSQIISMTKSTKWKIDEKKDSEVRIGNKKDNYSVMFIQVDIVNKIFSFKESGIILKVEKK